MDPISKQEALDYHFGARPGKIEVKPTKACLTQRDLSLAYTPGVAEPCLQIAKPTPSTLSSIPRAAIWSPSSPTAPPCWAWETSEPSPPKPVMEGKGVLFKRFADVDVFDIEINSHDPDDVIKVCQLLEPTFGGINLEDIKAPECFYIEETLKKTMRIPVFHDDQHGTAIICGAALVNARRNRGQGHRQGQNRGQWGGRRRALRARNISSYWARGDENNFLCDTKGVVYQGRADGMNHYKARFAQNTRSACAGRRGQRRRRSGGSLGQRRFHHGHAEVHGGAPDCMRWPTPMPKSPTREGLAARSDIIMASGRSDDPNQVNNILGFPSIFRGALDCHATAITEGMKLAATRALAALAKENVPQYVCRTYGVDRLAFGPEYIIPKPFDMRVLLWESPAVAQAAMDGGVAQQPLDIPQLSRAAAEAFGLSASGSSAG